tara:strand:- start:657 stop:830 length:174 start_codon:yes stop_codon:yes gene_type:complete
MNKLSAAVGIVAIAIIGVIILLGYLYIFELKKTIDDLRNSAEINKIQAEQYKEELKD